MSVPYEAELAAAVEAVGAAASVCRAVQAQITPDVLEKKDRSPVTVADFASQAVVCRALAEAFPNDPVIAEEDAAALRTGDQRPFLDRIVGELSGAGIKADADDVLRWIDHGGATAYSDRFWTLDPIDGTKGFLRSEQYAIALALIMDGRPQVAALCCPNLPFAATSGETVTGCVFSATRDGGTFCRPLDGPAEMELFRVVVSDVSDPAEARFCESVESRHSSHEEAARAAEILGIRSSPVRLDSQAKYAVVARGDAEIYFRLPTHPDYREKIWDHAAGVLVVEEAGGCVTDVAGRALDFSRGSALEENRGIVVTNGRLHERVTAALADVGVG